MIFKVIYDNFGNPVSHSNTCFCPSMSKIAGTSNKSRAEDVEIWEAPDIEQMIYDYWGDMIENKEISRQRAVEMMRLAPCVEAPAGIGKRSQLQLGESILMHERRPPAKTSDGSSATKKAQKAPSSNVVRAATSAPSTSHSDCKHPATKSARAACRRARAKASK